MSFYTPTEQDREKLKQPQGEIYREGELVKELQKRDYDKLIAVGDRVSQDIAESGLEADLSILDGSIQRKDVGKQHFKDIGAERTFKVDNPAGEITMDAWKAVRKASALECYSKIIVEGEEDLLALPAALFASESSVVVYGQPGEGAVLMETDREIKDFVLDLVETERAEHLIVGGSWDIFHSGHRYIILTALEKGETIDIGITSDSMLERKLGDHSEDSFDQRRSNIEEFLRSRGRFEDVRLIEIGDFYGNAVEEGDKLLVNPENTGNAEKINERRVETGRERIEVEVLEKLEAVDGAPISCTRIRDGEIDQNGLSRE